MSISDDLMWRYMELLSFEPMTTIKQWRRECAEGANPRHYKVRFAQEIVARFHDQAAAVRALETFEARFKQGLLPEDLPEQRVQTPAAGYPIANLLKDVGLTASTSESNRMIQQGGVKIDGEKLEDPKALILSGNSHILQVGKRKFARVTLVPA
jgi:tyrosyl-tRNA synthetase